MIRSGLVAELSTSRHCAYRVSSAGSIGHPAFPADVDEIEAHVDIFAAPIARSIFTAWIVRNRLLPPEIAARKLANGRAHARIDLESTAVSAIATERPALTVAWSEDYLVRVLQFLALMAEFPQTRFEPV